MRQIIFGFFVYVAIFAVSAMESNAQSRQTYFASGLQCVEAIKSGTANFYSPTFFKLYRPASSTEEVRGLESDACALMLTVKGYQWVAQKEDEKMVFRKTESGLWVINRRYDCGNPIKDILYPKTEVIETPVPTPTPVAVIPKCPPGTEESETPGICIEKVNVPGPPVVGPTVYINPCPTDAEFDGTTSLKSRLGGGLIQAGISTGVSAGITAARGSSGDNILWSSLKGLGLQRIQQGVNASEDGIKLRIPSLGIDQKISKGKNVDLQNGVSVRWNGSRVALFRNLNGQSFRCDGFGLKKGSNLGIWTDGESGVKTPVKTQSQSQIPNRTGTPGNPGTSLPVGNNGPVGGTIQTIPTRPTRNNLVQEAYGNQSNVGIFQATPSPKNLPCKGQIITINGIQGCND